MSNIHLTPLSPDGPEDVVSVVPGCDAALALEADGELPRAIQAAEAQARDGLVALVARQNNALGNRNVQIGALRGNLCNDEA